MSILKRGLGFLLTFASCAFLSGCATAPVSDAAYYNDILGGDNFQKVKALVAEGRLQLSLFDTRDMAAITSPEFPGERLIVCRNPDLACAFRRKTAPDFGRKRQVISAESGT